jgi:hypothetical protein
LAHCRPTGADLEPGPLPFCCAAYAYNWTPGDLYKENDRLKDLGYLPISITGSFAGDVLRYTGAQRGVCGR